MIKFLKESVFDFDDLYRICNTYDFFTMGSNEQYEKLFDLNRKGADVKDIALAIWLCSEKYSRKEIENILQDELKGYTYESKRTHENSMRKVTQAFLKSLIEDGFAEDVTDTEWETFKDKIYNKVYFSTGENGMNGVGFVDEDGNMYVITKRNGNLFRVI